LFHKKDFGDDNQILFTNVRTHDNSIGSDVYYIYIYVYIYIYRKDVAKFLASFLQLFFAKEPKRPQNLSVGRTTAGTDGHLLLC
jgi:hypothetical protein